MFDNNMETEAIPERVYSLCKLLENGKLPEKEVRLMVEPKCLLKESTPYFGIVRDAAKQLGLIGCDEDTKLLELSVHKDVLRDFSSFRRFINMNLSRVSNGQFYKTVQLYMYNSDKLFRIDKQYQNVSKLVGIINEYDSSIGLDEDSMRAWRFWATFLGFGYLHDMFFLPNAAVFLSDIIVASGIAPNKAYRIDEFVKLLHPAVEICLSRDDENNRKMNMALSNAFRTLHDLGVVELKTVNDRSDEWHMTDMKLHPFSSTITDVVFKGE